jgi:hypothetical protein
MYVVVQGLLTGANHAMFSSQHEKGNSHNGRETQRRSRLPFSFSFGANQRRRNLGQGKNPSAEMYKYYSLERDTFNLGIFSASRIESTQY